jgi:hypothetical protein
VSGRPARTDAPPGRHAGDPDTIRGMSDPKSDDQKTDQGQTDPEELPDGQGPVDDVASGGDDDQFEG